MAAGKGIARPARVLPVLDQDLISLAEHAHIGEDAGFDSGHGRVSLHGFWLGSAFLRLFLLILKEQLHDLAVDLLGIL